MPETRYLGIYLVGARCSKASMDRAKRAFNKACNGICSKMLGVATQDVILHLISVKCLPIQLYATEVLRLTKASINSLNFYVMRLLCVHVFKSVNRNLVSDCLGYMNFHLPEILIALVKINSFLFTLKYVYVFAHTLAVFDK